MPGFSKALIVPVETSLGPFGRCRLAFVFDRSEQALQLTTKFRPPFSFFFATFAETKGFMVPLPTILLWANTR